MSSINKLRTSKNGNEIYELNIGKVEGTKATFKSGNKGFRMFGKVTIDGKQFQATGNLIAL